MIRKLNANKSIHFHHRSFQAKPTLTQKKISIVSLALFKRKEETQRETWHNTLKLQMKKKQQSFKIDALHTHNQQTAWIRSPRWIFFGFVLFWKNEF